MNELELRQMFKNLSDCYADTTEYVEGKPIEGEVIQAMTEDRFIVALQQAKLLAKPAVIHSGNWKCLLCGRDKFTHKTPHKCVGGYRKRNIIWQKLS